MARTGFTLSFIRGELAEALAEIEKPIAQAATLAMREAAEMLKTQGRANIAAAGFSRKWQNAWRTKAFPAGGKFSTEAAMIGYHKIGYSDIFETGGEIVGKPILWLPLSSTPKRIGRRRMTPALYKQTIGPLFYIRRPGKPPLLAGGIALNRRGQRKKGSKVTLSALRRAGGGAPSRLVPLFIGVPKVSIPDKFSIQEIAQGISDRISSLYFKHLKAN